MLGISFDLEKHIRYSVGVAQQSQRSLLQSHEHAEVAGSNAEKLCSLLETSCDA
jgi:hypothetical protein